MTFLNEINLALENRWLSIPLFFIFGACFASFFNVVSLRFPRMIASEDALQVKEWLETNNLSIPEGLDSHIEPINLSFPSSHCYTCKTPLKWYHNIPILSYLFLRGKCGFCKTPFSAQYCIVEALGGLFSALVYFHFFGTMSLASFGFLYAFFLLTFLLLVVDFKTMYLPDEYNYTLLWGGLLATAFSFNFLPNVTLENSILGAVSIYCFTWIISQIISKLKGAEAMGGGDLKLLAAFGAIMGIEGAFFTLFYSPLIGFLFYLYFKFKSPENPQFPYGPALILSAWTYILCGPHIIELLVRFLS